MSGYILSLVCRLNILKVAYFDSMILNHELHKTLILLAFLDNAKRYYIVMLVREGLNSNKL